MNSTQVQTSATPIVAFLAGILAGKGVFGLDLATWTIVVGAIVGAVAAVWNVVITRKSAIVSQVAAMPEVKEVSLDSHAAGTTMLNAATPNNVVIK